MKKKNKKKSIVLFFLLILVGLSFFKIDHLREENKIDNLDTNEEFFQLMSPYAKRIARDYNLFPSVILAQAALESSYGRSKLSKEYNNYFGIKGTEDNGVSLDTEEIENGTRVKIKDYFRTYNNVKESFTDYGKLIGTKERYKDVREATSKEDYANNLYKTGYSTNPQYGPLLLQIVEQYNLEAYDSDIK